MPDKEKRLVSVWPPLPLPLQGGFVAVNLDFVETVILDFVELIPGFVEVILDFVEATPDHF